jgi:hypothetical protein
MRGVVFLVVAACAGDAVMPAKDPPNEPPKETTEPAPASVPACGEPAGGVRKLDSYTTAEVPGTYWLDMVFEGTEWRPAEPIAMPHHHATRLELTNVAEHPALAANQGKRLRFTVELVAREVRQVPGRQEWRATYQARIVAVCAP